MRRDNLFHQFLSEFEENMEAIEDLIPEIGGETPDVINELFRRFHTLKGLSYSMGLKNLGELAHSIEDILSKIRVGDIDITPKIISTIKEAIEEMKTIFEIVAEGGEEPNIDINIEINKGGENVYEIESDELREISKKLSKDEIKMIDNAVKKGKEIYFVECEFKLDDFEIKAKETMNKIKEGGFEIISTQVSPGEDKINFLFIVKKIKDGDLDIEGKIKKIFPKEEATKEATKKDGKMKEVKEEIKEKKEIKEVKEMKEKEGEGKEIKEKSISEIEEKEDRLRRDRRTAIRIEIRRIDEILNIVGDIVLKKNAIMSIFENISNHLDMKTKIDAKIFFSSIENRFSELQDTLSSLKNVQIGEIFKLIERDLKSLSISLGKKVEIIKEIEEAEFDFEIIEKIKTSLIHIARNAISHGIEYPRERLEKGKNEYGKIILRSKRVGDEVIIEVEDDGRGIDPIKVYQRFLELKKQGEYQIEESELIKEGKIIKEKVYDILFLPGFSTRKEEDKVSGRGVGLDVVKKNIQELRGKISIQSEVDKGTKFTIRIPIKKLVIKALIIEEKNGIYAIPLNAIQRAIYSKSKEFIMTGKIGGRYTAEVGGYSVEIYRISEILYGQKEEELPDDFFLLIMILGEEGEKIGIIANKIIGIKDVVLRRFPEYVISRGIGGIVETGDSRFIPFIDPYNIKL